MKERQGLNHQKAIPLLTWPDGSNASRSRDKAELLAEHFTAKMTVDDPSLHASHTPETGDCTLSYSCRRQDSHQVEFNHKLNLIKKLGERWQINFSPNKTQAMVVF